MEKQSSQQRIKKTITRTIAGLLCASLITSCATDGYASSHSNPTHGKNGSDIAVPLLIGAAAIGAIALAKRHKDKKDDRRKDYRRDHYNNHDYNRGYGHSRDRGYNRDYRNNNGHCDHDDRRNNRNSRYDYR